MSVSLNYRRKHSSINDQSILRKRRLNALLGPKGCIPVFHILLISAPRPCQCRWSNKKLV